MLLPSAPIEANYTPSLVQDSVQAPLASVLDSSVLHASSSVPRITYSKLEPNIWVLSKQLLQEIRVLIQIRLEMIALYVRVNTFLV